MVDPRRRWCGFFSGRGPAASTGVVALVLLLAVVGPGAADAAPGHRGKAGDERVMSRRAGGDRPVVRWDRAALRRRAARGKRFRVRDFPLGGERKVELELERFSVTSSKTRFVLGRKGGPDRPVAFDPDSVSLYRGKLPGKPRSHVFLALGPGVATGSVDPGDGSGRWRMAGRNRRGQDLGPDETVVYRLPADSGGGGDLPPGVPLCGNDDAHPPTAQDGDEEPLPPLAQLASGTPGPAVGQQHMELAIETDHEFWQLFGNTPAAAAYVTAMYGEVSAIYLRDVQTWVELTFVRLWDDPNDLFNDVDPSPLSDFRNYWNANMGGVQRDVAQLLSGRRDYPFGGQAYLSALCGSNAYGVVGYALGFFPDPSRPSSYHYDISVSAHELGHNAGTGHTHSSPNFIDTCDDPLTTAQRGTIMSYCGQTWSGGNGNRDLYFHTRIQQNLVAHIFSRSCIVDDCNLNGVADAIDIATATSSDVDGNGVPDECEDCNNNGTLDDQDVSGGGSADVDGNGVPDECQEDCNGNLIPDRKDIADGTSLDAHGNAIPDECETDCDSDSVSDYSEIQLDMTLDVDRNAELDACQDCDTDGTPDHTELAASHDMWLASGLDNSAIRRFFATSGVRTHVSGGGAGALVRRANDVIVSPSGRVLVASADDDRIVEFDAQGSYVGDLFPSGLGGLDEPAGLAITRDGVLLVVSHGTDSVLAYNLDFDVYLGPLVAAGTGGLTGPFGITTGPDGNLFVTSAGSEVLEFDGQDGSFVGTFVSAAANGGLAEARGITFKPDGDLLVASFDTDETLAYDGNTGAALGRWALSGNDSGNRLNQVSPWGIEIGPNGNVFIVRTGEAFGSGASGDHDHDHDHGGGGGDHGDGDHVGELHLTNAQVYEFDVSNGNFIRAHVNGNDHGHEFPTGLAFVPGNAIDCNVNQLPDACDIASGASADVGGNGIPDECEVDCNGNGANDRLDLIPHGASLDCNFNGVPDECDIAAAVPGACVVACNDGIDNDADGVVDYPADPGCASAADDSEQAADLPCDDGVDNDADGGIDAAGDPGCVNPAWPREDPRCQNGADDDGDGGIDYDGGASIHGAAIGPVDPQCVGKPHRDLESTTACGLGFEAGLAVLGLRVLRRRRGRP